MIFEISRCLFQSTSSVWRTTIGNREFKWFTIISIHVLRVEDDLVHKPASADRGISIHVLRVEDDLPSSRTL